MNKFMGDDVFLQNETARQLYHNYAAQMPIIDYHNHLDPEMIYNDPVYTNLSEVWLGGDHYKWRAMRAYGIDESLITGKDSDPYDRFMAWAETVEALIGNPLYHWVHLELQRYFDINIPLSPATAADIWDQCNKKLQTREYSVRNLLRKQNVEALCTTDDPSDDLKWHKKLKEDGFEIKVLPTFRPDQTINIEKDSFCTYLKQLGQSAKTEVTSLESLKEALLKRLDYFVAHGCRISDHSLESDFYKEADSSEIDAILKKRLSGQTLSPEESTGYHAHILSFLGQAYCQRGLTMQLHIGALRNNSSRQFNALGADHGYDSQTDFNYAGQLSALLDSMDRSNQLPQTILYYLNPKDATMLSCMAGNFQSGPVKGKVQLGAAWWFNDHLRGIEEHFDVLANTGLISVSVGMLTDSRSFLSFPRHEYFRRIWCNKIGLIAERGEYAANIDSLGQLMENVSYHNIKKYLNI